MRSPLGYGVMIAAVAVIAFVVGAAFFEPRHEGPFERAGAKIDKAIK